MKRFFRPLSVQIVVLVLALIIFTFLRLPSLFEPAWYGDEGIYAAIANELKNGETLYTDIWDHKPPGIYLLYQFSSLFAANQIFVYKSINFLFGLATVLLSYLVAVQLLGRENKVNKVKFEKLKGLNIPVALVTIGSAIYWGGSFLEGNIFNAENVFVPIMLLVFYLYLNWKKIDSKGFGISIGKMFALGLLSGIAMFFKIQPFFDSMVVCFVLLVELLRENKGIRGLDLKQLSLFYFLFGVGLILPLLVSFVYYLAIGGVSDFIFAVFTYNLGYSAVAKDVGIGFIFFKDTILLRSLLIFIGVLVVSILRFKRIITKENFFIIIWVFFSFFAIKLSDRAYPHYFLQFLVPALMFIGMGVSKLIREKSLYLGTLKFSFTITLLYVFLSLYSNGNPFGWGYISDVEYYKKWYGIWFGQNDYNEWTKIFNNDSETNRILASWLAPYTDKVVYIWGTKPWVYPLIDLNSPSKHLVYFHSEDQVKLINELVDSNVSVIVIEKEKEKYIDEVFLSYLLTNFQKAETLNNQFDLYLLR